MPKPEATPEQNSLLLSLAEAAERVGLSPEFVLAYAVREGRVYVVTQDGQKTDAPIDKGAASAERKAKATDKGATSSVQADAS